MRDLLVHVRDASRWSSAVFYAGDLAARLRGSLTGVHLRDCTEQSRSAAADRFAGWAIAAGVSSPAWQVSPGETASVIARLSLYHDVVIVDRGASHPGPSMRQLGSLVAASRAPVILVPPRRRIAHLRCIALAWNHSDRAIAAIHAARPLIERAERVVLLSGGAPEEGEEHGWMPKFDIDRYLGRLGIRADHEVVHGESAVAGEMIVALARRCRADLVVMGAYGGSALSEWALGGATRSVLLDATIPVLLKH